ncbi:MAG: competence/damage-inducible protein A [Acidimicrobiia bacterium]|nr:competence/damage-inducible protein A [Acidimicrobiia bacterium]
MIVEVIAVGTELLLGQIVNGNGAVIGRRLAEEGLDAHYQVVVGDNDDRLVAALTTALGRADAVILTGGIGPTQDDLTREAICHATGRVMAFSEEYAVRLRARWESTGRVMPESNLRQAEYPQGGLQLPNAKGTAPGIALQHDGTWIFALPGVPQEMKALLNDEVMPRLRRMAGGPAVVKSRLLRSWGMSESQVAELLDDLFQASVNPSVAFLASSGEIKVRITAKANTEEEASALIAPLESEVRLRLGTRIFGSDGETIEAIVLGMLERRGWRLATAESATGGLIAARITSVPGASRVFVGSTVCYTAELKHRLLDVPAATLAEAGVVSEETAMAMAVGAARLLGAEVAVSVTGSAGPDEQEQPAGTMVIGVHTPEDTAARTFRLPGDRERVRTYAGTAALQLVRLAVEGSWWRT